MGIYQERVAKAQEALAVADFGLMVLFPSSNMLYLSGFYDEPGERMLFLLVPREGQPVFLVPELYEQQVKEEAPFQDVRIWKDSEGPMNLLERALADLGPAGGRVLVDDMMFAMFLLMLRETLPETSFELTSRVMVPLRMRKTMDEINFLEEAGSMADNAFKEIMGLKATGLTELELSSALEDAMMRAGADKIAFETLVASGPNSALPHHRAGGRKIGPGDVVVLDYGCRFKGYCSDITRTIVCKEASKEVRDIYEIVARAQHKGVEAVRPGTQAQEVDRSVRGEITGAGYGERFIHRTGHGIGLDVHEEPYITEGNSLELKEGMAFSVEPGIYLPGRFGIRVEDIVAVTGTGAKPMNHSSHALHIIG